MKKYFILVTCAAANLYSMNQYIHPKTISPVDKCKNILSQKHNMIGLVTASWNEQTKPVFFDCLVNELISDLKSNEWGSPKAKNIIMWLNKYYPYNTSDYKIWGFKLLKKLLNELYYPINLQGFQRDEIVEFLRENFNKIDLQNALIEMEHRPQFFDNYLHQLLNENRLRR
jgi:hypothetical protein